MEQKLIRQFLVVIEEYDEPAGYVKIKTISGTNNVEDETSPSQFIFNNVQDFIKELGEHLNQQPEGKAVN